MAKKHWFGVGAIAVLVAGTFLTACAADHPDEVEEGAATCHAVDSMPATATRVDVTLAEWSVVPSVNTAKAGNVAFIVKNAGTMIHEMLVVHAEDYASVPQLANGMMNEDALPAGDAMGEIAEFDAGATCARNFFLPAGHYILICNIAEGDVVHAAKGMWTKFTVTA